jgi:hypothetical protein
MTGGAGVCAQAGLAVREAKRPHPYNLLARPLQAPSSGISPDGSNATPLTFFDERTARMRANSRFHRCGCPWRFPIWYWRSVSPAGVSASTVGGEYVGWVHFWQAAGKPFLISNLQGGHALRQGLTGRDQQPAVGAEGLGDAFAEVDKRWTRRPSLQLPSSAQAGHGDIDASCGSRGVPDKAVNRGGDHMRSRAFLQPGVAELEGGRAAPMPGNGGRWPPLQVPGRSKSFADSHQRRSSCLPQY